MARSHMSLLYGVSVTGIYNKSFPPQEEARHK